MSKKENKKRQNPANNPTDAPSAKEEDLKRAQTDIRSACGDEPRAENQRNPIIPPGGDACDTNAEPSDPKAPPKADAGTPGAGASGRNADSADMKDFDERMATWGGDGKGAAQGTEAHVKAAEAKADTDTKEAAGEALVEATADTTATDKELKDSGKSSATDDDLKRAQTDIRSACGDEPRDESQRNPIIPPGKDTCDTNAEPADPKAPPKADAGTPGAGASGRNADGADMKDFDERMATWGGDGKGAAQGTKAHATAAAAGATAAAAGAAATGAKATDAKADGDTKVAAGEALVDATAETTATDDQLKGDATANGADDDLKRARTDIRSACGDEPRDDSQRNPIIPPGREACDTDVEPVDHKAPPKADPATPGAGAGGRAPDSADMKEFDERMATWGGDEKGAAQGTEAHMKAAAAGAGAAAAGSAAAGRANEDDLKRAQTDIRSACGDEPRADHQRNPIIPPGRESCDIPEEPVDPKAPMRGDHYIKPGASRRARKHAAKGFDPRRNLDWQNAKERGEAMMDEAKAKGGAMVDEAGKILHPAIDKVRDRFFQKDEGYDNVQAQEIDMDFDEDACNFDPHVVEKITAKAIKDVDGVLGLHTSFVEGITQRFSDGTVPGVKAKVDDGEVRVRLRIVLSYDAERQVVFHAIKDKLLEKLDSACGLKLKAIQIDVADMMTREEYNKQNK